MAMVVAPGPVGKTLFTVAKLWLLAFPAAWYLLVEKGRPSWSPPRQGGLTTGLASGAVLATLIIVGAWLFGVQNMDLAPLRAEVGEMGLNTVIPYLAGAAGWTFINSLMEEYVYRWFIFRQSASTSILCSPSWLPPVSSPVVWSGRGSTSATVPSGHAG
jgi:membrane protease YdiL (CAAX protease family)